MSAEVSGYVVLRVSDKLSHDLNQGDDFVPLELIGCLLESAGLKATSYLNKTTVTDLDHYTEMDLSDDLGLEDKTKYINGYICLTVWGLDWIALSYVLSNVGDGLEIYSRLNDDEGYHYWFGRNAAGVVFENIGDDVDTTVSSEWSSFISVQVLTAFPDFLPNRKPNSLEGNATSTYQDSHFSISYPSNFQFETSHEIVDDLEWFLDNDNGLSIHIYTPLDSWNLNQVAEHEKSEILENYDEGLQVREEINSITVSDETVEFVTQQYYLEHRADNTLYESRIFVLSGPLARYAVVGWRHGTQDSSILDKIVKSIQLNR